MFMQSGNHKVPPLERVGGQFNIFVMLWVMLSCPVKDLRNETWGILEIFDDLWHFLRHDSWFSCQCSWASYVPSEGVNTVRSACECPNTFPGAQGEVLELSQLCNCNFVSFAWQKALSSFHWICFLLASSLICFKTQLVASGGGCSPSSVVFTPELLPPHSKNSPPPLRFQFWGGEHLASAKRRLPPAWPIVWVINH